MGILENRSLERATAISVQEAVRSTDARGHIEAHAAAVPEWSGAARMLGAGHMRQEASAARQGHPKNETIR